MGSGEREGEGEPRRGSGDELSEIFEEGPPADSPDAFPAESCPLPPDAAIVIQKTVLSTTTAMGNARAFLGLETAQAVTGTGQSTVQARICHAQCHPRK